MIPTRINQDEFVELSTTLERTIEQLSNYVARFSDGTSVRIFPFGLDLKISDKCLSQTESYHNNNP